MCFMGAAGSALVGRYGPSIDGVRQGRFLGFRIALQGSDGVLRQLGFGGIERAIVAEQFDHVQAIVQIGKVQSLCLGGGPKLVGEIAQREALFHPPAITSLHGGQVAVQACLVGHFLYVQIAHRAEGFRIGRFHRTVERAIKDVIVQLGPVVAAIIFAPTTVLPNAVVAARTP